MVKTQKNQAREDSRRLRRNLAPPYKGKIGTPNLFHQSQLMREVGEMSRWNWQINNR